MSDETDVGPREEDQVDERRTYVASRDGLTRAEAEIVCGAVLEVLRPVLHVAVVDAYSDFRDQLPPAVAGAQAWLRARGRQQPGRDPAMAVRVPTNGEQGWAVVRTYAAWSIDAEFFDEAGALLAWLHDGGTSVTADLTDSEAQVLSERLASVTQVSLLPERRGWRRRH